MTFATDLAALPNNAVQPDAKGFLPPIFRTAGHLLFVLAATAGDEQMLSEEESLAELTHAREHWEAIDPNGALSAAATTHILAFGSALNSAIAEWAGWENDVRLRNLRDLANRAASLTVNLDRELVGLRDSDAGTRL